MDNKLSELKVTIPADKKSRESVAAGYVTDNNSGGYFVIECQECGAVYPSQQADGGGQIADTGDYNDAICPHCGEEGPEECNNVGLAWNVQQAKIIALLAELEAKDKRIGELEDEPTIKHMRSVEEALISATDRASELEAKLATPVQASGWISWHGGMFRPVRSDTVIDVMFANGNVKPNICAGSVVFEWQKTPKDSQRVTAYRLHRRGV